MPTLNAIMEWTWSALLGDDVHLGDDELATVQTLCNFKSKCTAPLVGYARDEARGVALADSCVGVGELRVAHGNLQHVALRGVGR